MPHTCRIDMQSTANFAHCDEATGISFACGVMCLTFYATVASNTVSAIANTLSTLYGPAYGAVSTAHDLANFLLMLLNNGAFYYGTEVSLTPV